MAISSGSTHTSIGDNANITSTTIKRISASSTGMIVMLNGFPGTGKFTILKRAKESLHVDRICLLDNHLLIDPVSAVIPDRSAEHYELRKLVRAPIFAKLRQRAQDGWIIFMTACLAEANEIDAAFFKEHLDIVLGTEMPLFWINAHCEQTILERRVASPERAGGHKTKLTSVEILRSLLERHRLIDPASFDSEATTLVVKDIDVSGSVEDSISILMDLIGLGQ